MVAINIRLDPELYEDACRAANRAGITVTEWLRQCIRSKVEVDKAAR